MAALKHRFWKGNGAMSIVVNDFATDGPDDVYISEIRVHLSAAGGAGNLTVSVESNDSVSADDGPECNAVLSTTDMTSLTDKYLQPGHILRAVDHLKIEWANANARMYGVELIYRAATEWD